MELKLVSLELAKKLKFINFLIFEKYWYNLDGEINYVLYSGDESYRDYFECKLDIDYNLLSYENGYYFAPTSELVRKWFLETHKIFINVQPINDLNHYCWSICCRTPIALETVKRSAEIEYPDYDIALDAALIEACKIIG